MIYPLRCSQSIRSGPRSGVVAAREAVDTAREIRIPFAFPVARNLNVGITVRLSRLSWLVLPVALAGCGDSLGLATWSATPDTVTLFSLSRPELLGRPSAYDFVLLTPINVESSSATGNWDIVLEERSGAFVMVPASNFPTVTSRAGIALQANATTLEQVTEAPSDTSLFRRDPVPIQPGSVYVVRSRRESCATLGSGVFYAKIRALTIDASVGTFVFEVVRNPYCNDRKLIPPED
jgi:hypothetical protein